MANNDSGSYAGTLMVFLLGAAVGATCAILMAPASGAETRQQIADKAGELKDRASDLKDQVVEKAGQWKEAAASKLQGVADRAQDTMDTAREGANKVTKTARNESIDTENAARG